MTMPAFIIGNGPSTTPEILDLLTRKITFSMNRIAMLFDRTDWRPTYYIGTSSSLWDVQHVSHREEVKTGFRLARKAFCWDLWGRYLIEQGEPLKDAEFLPCSEINHIDHQDAKVEFWSDDPYRRWSKYGVTAFPAMQMAAYLGFNPIYLVGCDGGYKPPVDGKDVCHIDEGYRPFDAYVNYDYDEINAALQVAHEIAQVNCVRLGKQVYNLSPASVIKAHPFMPFEEAL